MHFLDYFINFFNIFFIPMGICFLIGFVKIRKIKFSASVVFLVTTGLFAMVWRLFILSPSKRYELYPAYFLVIPVLLGLGFAAINLKFLLMRKFKFRYINIFYVLFALVILTSIAKGISPRGKREYLKGAAQILEKSVSMTPDAKVLLIDYWKDPRLKSYTNFSFDTYLCGGDSDTWRNHALFLMLQKGRLNYNRIFLTLTEKRLKSFMDKYVPSGAERILKRLGSWKFKRENFVLCEYDFSVSTDKTTVQIGTKEKNPLDVLSVPQINVTTGNTIQIFYENIMYGRSSDNCVVEVNSPRGKQLAKCWSYTPQPDDKPSSFPVEIIIKDNAGWHLGRFISKVNINKPVKQLPVKVLVVSLKGKPGFIEELINLSGHQYQSEEKEGKSFGPDCSCIYLSLKDGQKNDPELIFLTFSQRLLVFASNYTIEKELKLIDSKIAILRKSFPKARLAICLPWASGVSQDYFGEKYGCGVQRWDYHQANKRIVKHILAKYSKQDLIEILPTNILIDPGNGYMGNSLRLNRKGKNALSSYLISCLKRETKQR